MELEESTCLTSGSTTKPQSSRQYGTSTKKYRSVEQNRKPRDKSTYLWTSLVAQRIKRLPAMQTGVQSLGCEDPLEKEMATYSSILAWEIPCT